MTEKTHEKIIYYNHNSYLRTKKMDRIAKRFLELDNLAEKISELDPRCPGKVKHSAHTILLITICGIFANCETWNEIAEYGHSKKEFFKRFITGLEHTPSHDTIRRFFYIVPNRMLELLYREWAISYSNGILDDSEVRHIAIDGKCIRSAGYVKSLLECSCVEPDEDEPSTVRVHMVSAYSVNENLSLGQEQVNEKSNEIPAQNELLSNIEIGPGDLITMDAMGTQRENARIITERGADYIFIVKGNQKKLHENVKRVVDDEFPLGVLRRSDRNDRYYEYTENDHGYTVRRTCYSVEEKRLLGRLYYNWPGIRTVGMIKTYRRNNKTDEETTQTQYFITSLGKDAEAITNYKRKHWEIENGLHRTLDVVFGEDLSQKKMNSAVNYSLITKMALAVLKNNKDKIPIKRKRLKAGWDDDYMEGLIREFIKGYAK